MGDQCTNQNSLLSDTDAELRKVARSTSMFEPINEYSETDDIFTSHSTPLHSGRITHCAPIYGSFNYDNKIKVSPSVNGKQRNKRYAIMPSETLQNVCSDGESHCKRNEHSSKSGTLGLCNNPDCISCSAARKTDKGDDKSSVHLNDKLHDMHYGEKKAWTKKSFSFLNSCIPIMNPRANIVQRWNKIFVISCVMTIFIDPLFFFLRITQLENKCILLNWHLALCIAAVRSVIDFIYFLHILLQFRLAYVAPESRVVGIGDLVDQPKKIAYYYVRGFFLLDLVAVFPLPQVMTLEIIPRYFGISSPNFGNDLLRVAVLFQYIPRIIRFLPLLAGRSQSGFIFESGWSNFFLNLLMYILGGHVLGSCWYLFGLQRLNQCLHNACSQTQIPSCNSFIDCGRGDNIDIFQSMPSWNDWLNDNVSAACYSPTGNFNYGIYQEVVLLSTYTNMVLRYTYSLVWGFLQISTFANNLVPSYFLAENIFTMVVIASGLLLFSLFIGNIQNYLQALGRRRLDMQLRRRDVEHWMSHRRFPENLRRKVRQAERFSWVAARGVDEEELLKHLPENLQREVHRHFFSFLKKVRLFRLMDEPILDVVSERLRQKVFIKGSDILYREGPVEKMIFIVRGEIESIGADGNTYPLSEGDVCGEELLRWCLQRSSINRGGGNIRSSGQRLFSNRTVRCLTHVEAFVLHAADLEEVVALFSRFLRNPRVQFAIRYESPYWRTLAATRIQVAWRYRQRRLKQTDNSNQEQTRSRTQVWQTLSAQLLKRKYMGM